MSTTQEVPCCAQFDPAPWESREIIWQDKKFVKARVRSFLHIPLNFAAVMKQNMARIEAAGAAVEPTLALSDENSLWGADLYIAVTKDVPGAENTTLSGTFLSRVYEGAYSNMHRWMDEMHQYALTKGRTLKKLYCYYTTCPKCAKIYGKNYIVMLAQV